jgi:RNA polymerase sigma-54 factor
MNSKLPITDTRQLHAHLHAQTDRLPLPEPERSLVCAIIDRLDDDGYLRQDLADVAAQAGLNPDQDFFEINTALRLVQSLQPAGVGARTLAESVTLQRRRAAVSGARRRARPDPSGAAR